MKMVLQRIKDNGEATLGLLFVNGEFQCFTLEDQKQEQKVTSETRVRFGKYKVSKKTSGRFYVAYYERWGHDFVPELIDVPEFTDILIHTGNTEADTAGCILVGMGCEADGEPTISSSRLAYTLLWNKIDRAFQAGEPVEIEIKDEEKRWISYLND